MEPRVCKRCGKSLEQRYAARTGKRGRPIVFCSSKCKDEDRNEYKRQAVIAARAPRSCRECGAPIDAERPGKTFTCSQACSVKWNNRYAKAKAKAERTAARTPCAECGGEIPLTKRNGSTYCSAACKKKAHDRRWRERAPGYMRGYLYGVTPQQYADMLVAQGHRCAVCGNSEWGGRHGVPHVDHCHATNKVRALLCDNCNQGLGRFKDRPDILRAAADYLELHQ